MTDNLKPCPFCGRIPKTQDNRAGGLHIFCGMDSCGQAEVEADSWEEAEAAWNIRAEPNAVKELADALKYAYTVMTVMRDNLLRAGGNTMPAVDAVIIAARAALKKAGRA